MGKPAASPFTKDVILAIALLYALAGIILYLQVGPWEAFRKAVLNGVLVIAWLWSAARILGDEPSPEIGKIRRPVLELIWALGILAIVILLAVIRYTGWFAVQGWLYVLVFYGGVLAVFLSGRYPLKNLGFRWPSRTGWLALLAVIIINILVGLLAQVLPEGEAQSASGYDLAEQVTGFWPLFLTFAGVLFRAAIPEELLLRVTLQPRLARFMPLGWAILTQTLLFNLAHLPQQIIGLEHSFLLAAAYLLPVDNGLIGGYLWRRTGSLPLLIILHLFAYPRFGV